MIKSKSKGMFCFFLSEKGHSLFESIRNALMIKEAQILLSKALILPLQFFPYFNRSALSKKSIPQKIDIFTVPSALNYIPVRTVLVMSCYFTKTRAREKYTAHKRVTFQMASPSPPCLPPTALKICDTKLNSYVVLRLIGLYL